MKTPLTLPLDFFSLFNVLIFNLKIISLNINGMNEVNVQLQLLNYIKFKRLDIIFIQEHNLRDKSKLSNDLLKVCDVYINFSIFQKGGTAILINKKVSYNLLSTEMSADSRIISLRIKFFENILHLINVYAPANENYSERDRFFQEDLLYYLRNNLNNVILGGNWNCVLKERDCQSRNIHISKALSNIVNSVKIKEAWSVKHKTLLTPL